MKHAAFAALGLSVLAACEAPTSPDFIGVTNPIGSAQAVGFFQTVCMANINDLSMARQTLATQDVILNTQQDIYYHTQYLISFKITPVSASQSVCSMVWDPREPTATSIASIQAVSPVAQMRDNEDGTISAFLYGAP